MVTWDSLIRKPFPLHKRGRTIPFLYAISHDTSRFIAVARYLGQQLEAHMTVESLRGLRTQHISAATKISGTLSPLTDHLESSSLHDCRQRFRPALVVHLDMTS